MKTWTLQFQQVDKDNFEEVRSGVKEVETRAATVRYEPVQEGDSIRFVCGQESFTKHVTKKHHFKSIDAMIKKIPFKRIMPDVNSIVEMKKRYASYPGYEGKIKKHGLFAFELK